MPSMVEIQIRQKEWLFDLLTLEKRNSDKKVIGLSYLINRTKAGMGKEDIAYIEQLVAQNDDV